jgi:hypothetical protein
MSLAYRPRPAGVTTVVVLTYVAAFVDVVGGIALVVGANDDGIRAATDATATTLQAVGWTLIAVGVITAAVGMALNRGSRFARILVTVLMTIRLGTGFWALFGVGATVFAEALLSMLIAALVIGMLWSRSATEFFEDTV